METITINKKINDQGASCQVRADVAPAAKVDISHLSEEQKAALRDQLNAEAKESRINKRDAYEGLRAEFMHSVLDYLLTVEAEVKGFKQWLDKETEAFTKIMSEYGQVRKDDQQSFTITDGNFRLLIKTNKVKGFDERANMAADRLVVFLNDYMSKSEKGQDDPMYQLAMTLLERNRAGDLDYKSISKLYEMEDKFHSSEYSDIMQLFKESNVVEATATNYYFERQTDKGVWKRIEPSFCRL